MITTTRIASASPSWLRSRVSLRRATKARPSASKASSEDEGSAATVSTKLSGATMLANSTNSITRLLRRPSSIDFTFRNFCCRHWHRGEVLEGNHARLWLGLTHFFKGPRLFFIEKSVFQILFIAA